jgi:hypothetical protein
MGVRGGWPALLFGDLPTDKAGACSRQSLHPSCACALRPQTRMCTASGRGWYASRLRLSAGGGQNTSPSAVFTVPCSQEFNLSAHNLQWNVMNGCGPETTLSRAHSSCKALAIGWRDAGSRDVADAIMRRRGTGRHSRRAFEAGTAPSKLLHARHATDATPGIRGAPGPLGDARGTRKAKTRLSPTGGGAAASAERARWGYTIYRALDAGCTPQHSLGTASERPDGPERMCWFDGSFRCLAYDF